MKITMIITGVVFLAVGCFESDENSSFLGTNNEPYGGYEMGNQAALEEEMESRYLDEAFALADIKPLNRSGIEGSMSAALSSENALLVQIDLVGLKPGSTHGIHIHENASCSEDGMAAGGHLNPYGVSHGTAKSGHLGDLGNVTADEDGYIESVLTKAAPTTEDFDSWEVILDRSIVIHEKADDLSSDPSGNSGERIACAVIQRISLDMTH